MCVCVCAHVNVERSGLETDLEMLLGRKRDLSSRWGESKAGEGGAVAGEGGACSPAALQPGFPGSVTLGKLHAV